MIHGLLIEILANVSSLVSGTFGRVESRSLGSQRGFPRKSINDHLRDEYEGWAR